MKRWIMVGLLSGLVAGLITGCEWTTGGGVDSWSGRYNWVNFSGVYRASSGKVLVSSYSGKTYTEVVGNTSGGHGGSGGGGTSTKTETFAVSAAFTCDATLHWTPIIAGSISIITSGGTISLVDDGAGVLIGTPVGTGTINYNTGVMAINFQGNNPGASCTVTYIYNGSSVSPGVTNFASSGRVSHTPVEAGSFSIAVGSTFVLTDNGSGLLSGSGITGSINYNTGAWTIDYGQLTVPSDTDIVAAYRVVGSDASGASGSSIYSFTVYQEGETLRIVDNNGAEYHGQFGGVRTTFGGDDTSTSLPVQGDTVIAQFSAEGTSSSGYSVSLVGTMQGTVANNYLSSRIMTGTWIEDGGKEGNINGVADSIAIDTSTTVTEETTTE